MHLSFLLTASTLISIAFSAPAPPTPPAPAAKAPAPGKPAPKPTPSPPSPPTPPTPVGPGSNGTTNLDGDLSNGFTINQGLAKVWRSGTLQLAACFGKYHGTMSKDLEKAAKKEQKQQLKASKRNDKRTPVAAVTPGQVTATPEAYDQEYLCPVTVGGQLLNLDFDTGSADLWVFSNQLSASSQAGHSVYNPAASTTSRLLQGQTWNIQYGDGSAAAGIVYADTVRIGPGTVTSQAVEAAQSVSVDFVQDVDCDGLLGLSFSTLNQVRPTQQKTWFDTAISQGLRAMFTANLKKGGPGTFGFGMVDTTQYNAPPTYVPVDNSQGFWTFTAAGYGIGNTYTATALTGIADTGTSLLVLPGNIVTAYWNTVAGARYDPNYGAYTFPCAATLPNFFITLGSAQTRYTVPGNYLNFAPLGDGTNYCYGGLQSSDGMGMNIFGDIFLKAFFVIFDKTNVNGPRLGLATKPL